MVSWLWCDQGMPTGMFVVAACRGQRESMAREESLDAVKDLRAKLKGLSSGSFAECHAAEGQA